MKSAIRIKTSSKILSVKLTDYAQLVKVRLSALVVFSSAMAYLWATNRQVDPSTIWLLSIGGFFVTGSANIFNQIIERGPDKLMKRTSTRPLAAERMRVREAIILALLLGLSGSIFLSLINPLCAALAAVSMLIYVCVYTPSKKITQLSVVPGAIAGSLPIIIGWVAATGEIDREALLLFFVQFLWQFPHTWSIAWLLDDDYNKAGFKMLPVTGKNKTSAGIIMLSTFLIIPSGLLLYMYGVTGIHVTWMLAMAGMVMLIFALRLFYLRTDNSALGLMLSSFAYLPLVLILLVTEHFI